MLATGMQQGFIPAGHNELYKVASSVTEAVELALKPHRDIDIRAKF